MVDQFILELKLQTFLNHQNLLTLYGNFEDRTHVYLILEYMEEGTLFSLFKKNKILPEPEVAKKIRQIASSIKYLHENQIAHRDIKPENIVMSHVFLKIFRVFASFAISAGRLSVMIAGKLTVELLIMPHLKFLRASNTIIQWTCGVWGSSHTSY